MNNSHSDSYKAAGVDVTAGYEGVRLMKKHIEATRTPGVIGSIGGFGGLFAPDMSAMKEPVLVSGTDGVGTKLKIAFLMDKHDTVGIDCVAMCVNDIICGGAKPLFFLDYIALGKNEPAKVEQIVKGVSAGCVMGGCALVGGETAEMPGFYPVDEYDLAGFSVGIVDKSRILDGEANVRPGDVLVAFPSSGVHSNGFSLVRKIFDVEGKGLDRYSAELGRTLGEALLEPTRIYVKPLLACLEQCDIHGVSHITGGGFYENIPRMLGKGVNAVVRKNTISAPPIFALLESVGKIPNRDMYNTFNMGVGMISAVAPQDADKMVRIAREHGENAFILGEITAGTGEVEIIG